MSTTAAERVAALTAIRHGIDQQILAAKAETLVVAHQVGVKAFTTPWGQVTIARSEGGLTVRLDDLKFMRWVMENYPSEVETFTPPPVTRVAPGFVFDIRRKLVAVGGDVVFQDTGEVVTFASVVRIPDGDEYVTYPAGKAQKAAKAAAAEWAAERVSSLADGFREASLALPTSSDLTKDESIAALNAEAQEQTS